jgi:phospholipase/lecithinase/hemolysin
MNDLRDLVGPLRQAHARVVVIGIPDVSHLPAVQRQHIEGVNQIVTTWNASMRQIARQSGAYYLDLQPYGSEMAANPSYVAPDGLHPSTLGHARLAQVVVTAIRQWGLWPAQP